jgi:hypothetical protein
MPNPYIQRALPLKERLESKSVILLGPYKVGKNSLIRNELSPTSVYNLAWRTLRATEVWLVRDFLQSLWAGEVV